MATELQREQRELAAFHLDQGRRLFEREQDRRYEDREQHEPARISSPLMRLCPLGL